MKNKIRLESKSKLLVITIAGLIAVAFLSVIIGGIIVVNKNHSEMKQLSTQNTELGGILAERDSMVNVLINAFDTIEQNLTFINERRSKLVIENSETSNRSKKESIIKDIQLMNAMLEESSMKIEKLEKELKNSGVQLRSFKNKIASLNKRIEQQNNQIAEFKFQIEEQNARLAIVYYQNDSLQNEILSIRDSIYQKEEILLQKEELITQQVTELNKGFFAYGTFKELSDNGVVEKDGGFLGIGQNKILQKDFNEDYFTEIDITQNRSIPLNVKKVKLISEHPGNSYKLIEENGLITRLEIETPEDFWKLSNYAVIEVKL